MSKRASNSEKARTRISLLEIGVDKKPVDDPHRMPPRPHTPGMMFDTRDKAWVREKNLEASYPKQYNARGPVGGSGDDAGDALDTSRRDLAANRDERFGTTTKTRLDKRPIAKERLFVGPAQALVNKTREAAEKRKRK